MSSTIGIKKIQHPNGTQVMTFDTAGKISSNVSSTGNITTTGTVNTPSINGGQIGGRRNLIINGAMSVAQRGTSITSVTGSGYQTVDRFRPSMGTAGTWTITQSTDVPTGEGFANSLKFDCTTANGSLSAGSDMALQYRMEGQDLQLLRKGTSSALSVTLSFWVKSTKTGTFICELQDNDNSRNISKAYTVSTTNTWEKKELTFAGDTTGTFGNDNAKSMTIMWWQVAGTNYTSGTLNTSWAGSVAAANRAVGQVNIADNTSNDWLITGVQMELGSTATAFENKSFGEELALCQRYYTMSWEYGNSGSSLGNPGMITAACVGNINRAFGNVFWTTEMRAAPTVTWYNGSAGTVNKWRNASQGTDITAPYPVAAIGTKGYGFGLSAGIVGVTDQIQGHYEAEAEL